MRKTEHIRRYVGAWSKCNRKTDYKVQARGNRLQCNRKTDHKVQARGNRLQCNRKTDYNVQTRGNRLQCNRKTDYNVQAQASAAVPVPGAPIVPTLLMSLLSPARPTHFLFRARYCCGVVPVIRLNRLEKLPRLV